MADVNTDVVKAVVSGLVMGGSSAAMTFLTVFRNIKKRVETLEENLGSQTDPKTGLHLVVSSLEDTLRRVRREIDGWEDHPPEWAKRLVTRARVSSSSDLNTVVDIESRVDARIRSFHERLAVLEQASPSSTSGGMSREEYLEDVNQRTTEISQLREQVAAVNGLLRGILVALGRDPERN